MWVQMEAFISRETWPICTLAETLLKFKHEMRGYLNKNNKLNYNLTRTFTDWRDQWQREKEARHLGTLYKYGMH